MDYEKKYNQALERARKEYNSHLEHLYEGYRKHLEEIFPELTESEDERIRNILIDAFEKKNNSFIDELVDCRLTKADILAYLEKQKELPTNEEMLRILRTEYEKGVADTIAKYEQKEQKSIFPEGLGEVRWNPISVQKEQKPAECIPDSIKFDEGFKTGREVGFREGVESVKPAEWGDEDENIRQSLILLVSNDKKNGYTEFYKAQEITCDKVIAFLKKLKQLPTKEEMLRTLRVEYEKGVADTIAKYEQKEQKPTEKSEISTNVDLEKEIIKYTDKISLKELNDLPYTHLDECARYFYKLGCNSSEILINPEERFAKAREKYEVEWSEEDEHRRKDAIYFLESAMKHYADTSEIEKTISWLKSLRPQSKQEWDNDDYVCFSEIVSLIRQHYRGENIERGNELINWLKGYEPQPSWKPSEEQMDALAKAVTLYGGGLDSLYQDLKKLM